MKPIVKISKNIIIDQKPKRPIEPKEIAQGKRKATSKSKIMKSIAIAVKAKLKKSDFDLTVGIHPSAAEEFVTMKNKR